MVPLYFAQELRILEMRQPGAELLVRQVGDSLQLGEWQFLADQRRSTVPGLDRALEPALPALAALLDAP